MTNKSALISETTYSRRVDPAFYVPTRSQQDALQFLSRRLARPHYTALLQAPEGGGKSATARQLAEAEADVPVALLDGAHLTAREMLLGLVSGFGIEEASQHEERLLRSLHDWLVQSKGALPLLIIDDVDRASTSALRLVDWLAALERGDEPALRIALVGREPLSPLLRHESLKHLAGRKPGTYSLNPMSLAEARCLLRSSVTVARGTSAERLFPAELCAELHLESRGWPGALNRLAEKALAKNPAATKQVDSPRLILTCDGDTVSEIELTERLYVIGRSELADIVVNDPFASKMHAMLQVYRNALVLFDLNSTNGTTVNANEVRKTLLRSNDVISLGRHRLKILDAPQIDADVAKQIRHSDTMTVRHLADLRRKRARRNVVALRQV